jgi:hypothetical protein
LANTESGLCRDLLNKTVKKYKELIEKIKY